MQKVKTIIKIMMPDFVYEILRVFEGFLMIFNIPLDILPMAILRPISGTTTLAILNDLFESFGPDSFVGRLASVIQGATDTTLYVLTLYFGSVGIKKIKYALVVMKMTDACFIIKMVSYSR